MHGTRPLPSDGCWRVCSLHDAKFHKNQRGTLKFTGINIMTPRHSLFARAGPLKRRNFLEEPAKINIFNFFKIFAHMQNLEATRTFSNEFSGVSRVHQKLHVVCSLAHKQPQPKRIDATRVMVKKPTKNYK